MPRRGENSSSGSSDLRDLATLVIVGVTGWYVIQNPVIFTKLGELFSNFNLQLPNIPSGGGGGGLFGGGGNGSSSSGTPKGSMSGGIKWFRAHGPIKIIKQTRDDAGDYRWSGNVSGLSKGAEATMYAKFSGVSGDGHFAMKIGGPNRSGGKECCWWDHGIRSNGDTQTQTEKPRPNNHTYKPPLKIKNIGKQMDGNMIGLKWLLLVEGGKTHHKMWVDTSGSISNQWRLVFDFVDNYSNLKSGYSPPDEWDCEVRISDTKNVETSGLHVRRL